MSKTKTLDRVKKYQAVIIGAGRIGATFDGPQSADILTHAHAFSAHPQVELAGFYDNDIRRAQAAAQRWDSRIFNSLTEMFAAVNPDIVSVCVPDGRHYAVLLEILKFRPSLVICEKPLTHQFSLSKKIVQKFFSAGVPLAVNYSRRFDPAVKKFCADLKNGQYGRVLSAIGVYNKGLLHTGSHLLNLAEFLFGKAKEVNALGLLTDYRSDDPSISGYLKFQRCPSFHLAIADSRVYEVFELDMFLEKGRVRFTDFGLSFNWQDVRHDSKCPEFQVLGKEKKNNTELNIALAALADNAVNFLAKKEDLLSPASEALHTEIICEKLFKQLKK